MKKRLVLLATAIAVGGIAGVASAQPNRSTWNESRSYALLGAVGFDTDLPGVQIGHVSFDPGPARSVRIAIEDAAAPSTLAVIRQGDSTLDSFCTSSDKATRITPYVPIRVGFFAGSCDGTPSFATTGMAHATFSKR